MSEHKTDNLDIKDIKSIVEEGLQTTQKNWDKSREADKEAFDKKVSDIVSDIEAKQKAEIEAQTKQISDLETSIVELKKKGMKGERPLNFKQALGKMLSDEHEGLLKDVNSGKFGRALEVKDFNWADFSGNEEFRTDYVQQPITNPYSAFHYRDIIPRGSTSEGILSYPKEGVTTGAADSWMHTGDSTVSKPEIAPSLSPYTVSVNWIAGLIKGIPVDMLEDLPWLTSFLQQKAMNELMKAEDLQIQEGTGVNPDLDGFFNGTNATAYDGTETKIFAQIIDAAYRQIANSSYNANRAVISNADKVSILLNTESGAGYNLPQGSISIVNGQLNFAGLDVVSNAYLDPGQALIGDFNESQFVIRSNPRLRFFEQNETDAEKNQIMIRIEERVALAIFSNLAFVKLEATT